VTAVVIVAAVVLVAGLLLVRVPVPKWWRR
jgi:hypothetical protein